ncbi:MAG: hypothetical protein ACRDPK_20120 [Carbonactinosporaceae bacterium]
MPRRVSLPGADELFRVTAAPAAAAAARSRRTERVRALSAPAEPVEELPEEPQLTAEPRRASPVARSATRRPTGRERHNEKITVYISAEELIGLEQARITLRSEHGLVVDRGRIVREALAVVLADFDARGEGSVLARRLQGA